MFVYYSVVHVINILMDGISAPHLYPKQMEVLKFLKQYVKKYQSMPKLKDIAKALNLRANSTIHQHLESLEKKGLIRRGRFNNTIEIVEKDFDFSDVKDVHLLGYIAAGKPLEAIEDKTNIIRISKDMYGSKDIFALKVKGDSMIDAHIMDGDTIIVESKTTADEGQIVVALLEDYSATLKVYSRDEKKKKYILKPMNEKYEPIVTDKLYIQGILLGVIRGY